ncbi:multiprotein bridging factor aMBF1 [Halostella sp. PRR32]|uniref:multiprotein bridging factor aMBF1 n=1 Tax=Halostella sp. PRR32 TaxID=3098147 RepID=UPI002B1D8802|nr:multiprotein bridging factor aMBF1 [Halostella sp. PRR32]
MVQCEMCGAETSSPKKVKVEGAELDVCGDCADFGTEVKQQSSSGETSTKYSTGSSNGSSTSSSASGGSSTTSSTASSGGSRNRSDMFDDMDELAQDYDEIIRRAREEEGLSQADLADELNEKASLIRKLERGDTLPSDDVQTKLERFLDVNLSGGAGGEDTEWEGGSSSGEYTLGDVVKRKD